MWALSSNWREYWSENTVQCDKALTYENNLESHVETVHKSDIESKVQPDQEENYAHISQLQFVHNDKPQCAVKPFLVSLHFWKTKSKSKISQVLLRFWDID